MTAEKKKIRGKVAKVFSDRQVALNVGKDHEVEVGMLFDIVVQQQHAIEDPDTGELLGNVKQEIPKARIRVTSVEDRYSIAAMHSQQPPTANNPTLTPTLKGDLYTGLFNVFAPRRFTTTESSYGNLAENDRLVSTGNPVVQVVDASG